MPAICEPKRVPNCGTEARKSAPICRMAVRFSSATRTLSNTCCEVGTRIRLMTWNWFVAIWLAAIAPGEDVALVWIGVAARPVEGAYPAGNGGRPCDPPPAAFAPSGAGGGGGALGSAGWTAFRTSPTCP